MFCVFCECSPLICRLNFGFCEVGVFALGVPTPSLIYRLNFQSFLLVLRLCTVVMSVARLAPPYDYRCEVLRDLRRVSKVD
jgi:hypothetical protein